MPPPLRPKALLRQKEEGGKLEVGLRVSLHKLVLTRASGLDLGASGVGFGLLRQREGPGGKSLRAPGKKAKRRLWSLV
jgi:hypothetical protein